MFPSSILLPLLLQLFLILINAIFASAEISIISINDSKLALLSKSGDKRARRLTELTDQPAKFLATIQVGITLAGFLGSAFAADNFSDLIVNWIIGMGFNIAPATLNTIIVVIITLILSYFTLIFGIGAKANCYEKCRKIALNLSGLINFLSKIINPIVWFAY